MEELTQVYVCLLALFSFHNTDSLTVCGTNFCRQHCLNLSKVREGWRYQIGWIFRKVPKGGRVIFNPKIYVADFGNFKQGFLSMKLIQKSNFRVQDMFFSTFWPTIKSRKYPFECWKKCLDPSGQAFTHLPPIWAMPNYKRRYRCWRLP